MAGNDAQNWAFLAAIRASDVTSPDDDIAHDFPRFLGESWATHGSAWEVWARDMDL